VKIAFRVDASAWIGSGHVIRCLTLADALCTRGAETLFVCRDFPGNLCGLIADRGHPVQQLPFTGECRTAQKSHSEWLGVEPRADADETLEALRGIGHLDWLMVDHYGIDRTWEGLVRHRAERIAVVDDLADRPHVCDLILDQNLYRNLYDRYKGLVPAACRSLLGPAYALLRPEFARERMRLRQRDGRVRRILVFFGGYDATNETEKALMALNEARLDDIAVDVVVGAGNPHRKRIEKLCQSMPQAYFHCQVSNMAELMAAADLSLGAGGATSWERFSVGLPSMILALADNQEVLSEDLGEMGLAIYLGRSEHVDSTAMGEWLLRALARPEQLLAIQDSTLEIVDGLGAGRVVDNLLD